MTNVATAEVQTEVQPGVNPSQSSPAFTAEDIERIKQETAKNSFKSGYEKGKSEVVQPSPQINQVQQPVINQTAQAGASQDQVSQWINDELERRAQAQRQQQIEEQGKQVLNSIMSKAQNAQKDIPDYDQVTSKVDWSQIPQLLGYADSVDNGGHVLYHLAKNPMHIGSLLNLPPQLALQEVKRLSDSMKINQAADQVQMPNEPLGRMQTSTAGVGNNNPSFQDLRKKYRV